MSSEEESSGSKGEYTYTYESIQDYTQDTDYVEIGKKGFLLPLISLINSILFYVLTMVITLVNNISGINGHPVVIPGYVGIAESFGIVIFAMTLLGYFQNFTDGASYPKKAVIYGSCAIVGLIFFWAALLTVNPKSLGVDAITSSMAAIILTFAGAIISYKYFRNRSNITTPTISY
jgi:hypothetical protein